MTSDLYSKKYSMVNLGIIDEEGYLFTLPEDTKEKLIEDNHFCAIKILQNWMFISFLPHFPKV
ncbi:Uncharacterised protein [Photobacterium damselae]|nr:Uncharacterised protein [Photobacterium damselae]